MENEALLSPELESVTNMAKQEVTFVSTNSEDESRPSNDEGIVFYKLYRRRWIMLVLLTFLTAENIAQWLFYSAIDNIVKRHFGVSSFMGQLLSWNNLAIIMIFGLPATSFVNRTDLKAGCLISGLLSLVALWVKFFGTHTGGFYLSIIGQIIASFGTCFVLPLPAQLASTWFGVFERSTATSIAASGLSFGMGLAYVLSVQFVPDSKDDDLVQDGLQKSIMIQTIICSFTILLTVLLFERKPKTPPTPSQAVIHNQQPRKKVVFREPISNLVRNKSYMLTLLSFGIITGVLYSFFSLLNDIILPKFKHEEKMVGWMGFLGSVSGIPGMLLSGMLLDKTKAYKNTFVVYTALIALTTLGFTFAVKYAADNLIPLLYALVGLFGFLTSGLTTIGFVLAGELTYPKVPELFSTAFLLVGGQFFGVLILGVTSYAITAISIHFVNIFMTVACFLALIFTPFIKSNFHRLAHDVLVTDSNAES